LFLVARFNNSTFLDSLLHPVNAAPEPAPHRPDRSLEGSVKWYDTGYLPLGWHKFWLPGFWADQGVRGLNGIEGVSRYGKAALVTMAFEPRFAMGLIGSSGEGGAKLHRRNFGEAVES
jgi:hypothetical protein